MINKKIILENAIRFGFVNELKKSNKNQKMIDYAVKLGFAVDKGDEAEFPWNKTGDPTYETWLLNQLKVPNHSMKGLRNGSEDNPTLERFISEFDRLKKQRQITGVDINQLDFSQVKKIVNDNEQKISRKALERGDVETKTKSGYELKIFKDESDADEVVQIGLGTDWCTNKIGTAKSFLRDGAIYIIFKDDEPYVQMHVETQQYMDVNDSPIKSETWKELRQNIPFINQLVTRMKIVKGMNHNEIMNYIGQDRKFVGLDLQGTDVQSLPDNLDITTTLDISNTAVKELPKGLKASILDMEDTPIKSLPSDLQVNTLMASNSELEEIPNNLNKFEYDLIVDNTKIKKLPDNLKVGEMLDVSGLKLEITSPFYAYEFIAYKSEIVFKEKLIVKREAAITNSKVKFSAGTVIGGNLNLQDSTLESFPDDLNVIGEINLAFAKIKRIPSSIRFDKIIFSRKSWTHEQMVAGKDEIKQKFGIEIV